MGPEPTEDLDPIRDLPLYALQRTPWDIDPEIDVGMEQKEDPFFGPMITYLQENTLPTDFEKAKEISTESPKYQVVANRLYYCTNDRRDQPRLLLAIPEKLRYSVFEFLHSDPTAGHLGTQKTTDKIGERYYWPNFREDILTWVKQCDPCAMKKNPPKTHRAPLVPVQPLGRFQCWALDIHGPMPVTEDGYKYLAIFMEYSTRYPEAFPIRDVTAQTMADLFIRKIVCRYGVPMELLTDQGAQLTSEMMKYVCAKLGTLKIQTSAYHPASDGLVERFMSTLVKMLAQYMSTTQKDWSDILDYVLFAYRTSVQSSLKESSHFLVFGCDALIPIDSALGLPNPAYVDQPESKVEFIQRMNQAWQLAAGNLEKSQQKQKRNYDQKLNLPEYRCQDLVWIYTPSVKKGRSPKLSHLWHGPFRILKITGPIAWVRPANNPRGITKWVHFNGMKPCHSTCLIPLIQATDEEPFSSSVMLPASTGETPSEDAGQHVTTSLAGTAADPEKSQNTADHPYQKLPTVAHRVSKTK